MRVKFQSELYVRNTEETINLNSRNDLCTPYALLVPQGWEHPMESIDIGLAYSNFLGYVQSSGENNKDWYKSRNETRVFVPLRPWAWMSEDQE